LRFLHSEQISLEAVIITKKFVSPKKAISAFVIIVEAIFDD
jgi:hypothetical protein